MSRADMPKDELERSAARLARLQATTAALAAAKTPEDVALAVFEHGLAAMAASGAAISTAIDSQRLKVLYQIGVGTKAMTDFGTFRFDDPLPAAEAFRTGRTIWLGNAEQIAGHYPHCEPYRQAQQSQAWAVLPLHVEGRTFGTLSLLFREPQAFDAADRAFIETLADQCAQALERARLFEALRQSAEQLLRANQRLQAIMDAVPVGVAYSNDASCECVLGNAALRAQLDLTPDQNASASTSDTGAPGRQVRYFHRGVLLPSSELPLQRAVRENRAIPTMELEIELPSGRRWIAEASAAPVRDDTGAVAGGVAVTFDVSERRRVEERFRSVFEQAAVGIALFSLDGRFLETNQRYLQMFGYAWSDLAGRSFDEITAAQDRETDREQLRRLLDGELKTYSAEKRYLRKDGSLLWVHLTRSIGGEPSRGKYLISVVQDISSRKASEEALRSQNAVLEGIARIFREAMTCPSEEQLGQVTLGILEEITQSKFGFVADLRSETGCLHPIAISNPGWEACKLSDPIVAAAFSGFAIHGLYGLVVSSEETLLTNTPSLHPDRVGLPAGHPPLTAFLGVPLFHGGAFFGMIGLGNREGGYSDLQKEAVEALAPAIVQAFVGKRAELERMRANERLAEADRNKNEFLAMLSHELRNPLAPIRNSLHILDRVAPGSEQAQRAKQVIDRQVGHLSALVADLLDITRITRNKVQLQRERLDFGEALRRAVEDNRSIFERAKVELTLLPLATPMCVYADRTRMAQILGNLLQNAAKFTRPGGHAWISAVSEDGEVVLRITDDGVGMTPAVLERLFQPFMQAEQTLDRSEGGLGLGLALVKGLVELHGGSITARSEGPGKGSEFTVRVALDIAPACASGEHRNGTSATGSRVLIIEDNVDAAQTLREVLELDGHVVAVAHAGPEGIALARAFRPDVVLCDIGLPGMDGFEVARTLRAEPWTRNVYLVALSGYALPEDAQRALQAGFDRHMAKPLTVEALESALACAGHGLLRTTAERNAVD